MKGWGACGPNQKRMGWINGSWKLLAAVAVMHDAVPLKVCGVRFAVKVALFLHSVFVGLVTQLCSPSNMCVWSVDTRVHTRYINSLSVFTTLGTAVLFSLHSGVVVLPVIKLTWYLHQTPSWLWLVSPVFTPPASQHNSTNNAWTPPYQDTCQVCEYLDYTKVLTVCCMFLGTGDRNMAWLSHFKWQWPIVFSSLFGVHSSRGLGGSMHIIYDWINGFLGYCSFDWISGLLSILSYKECPCIHPLIYVRYAN